ncbi:MAG: TolC family protein [Nostoc sp.]|uniref:TolC family protein n=1 Tax=Nostoc sp. TaxID=1180 RepID=UPI002FF96CB6
MDVYMGVKLRVSRRLLLFLCITIESLVCSCISSPVVGQTAKILTLNLEGAITKAEANNPQLLTTQRSINVAQAGVAVAKDRLNPRFSLDIPFGEAETKRIVGIEQLIELGGKRGTRLALANSQVQQAQLQLDNLRWQIRTQVRQAYTELAIAQGAQQNAEQSLAINQQLVDIAKLRFQVDDVAKADVVQAEFALSQAQQKVEPAVNRVHQAIIRLNTLLGQPTDTVINLVDGQAFTFSLNGSQQGLAVITKLPEVTGLKKLAKASRLDLALAEQQIQINNNQIQVARSARIPDVTLAASFVWDPGLSTASVPSSTTTAVILGARVDLPVFNSGASGVKQARANFSVAQAQKIALESQIDSEVAIAYENIISAQRLLERDRTVLLPQALEVLNLSRNSYQYGQTGLSDALLNQQSVQSVFDNFYADILAYQTALGALEQVVNLPISAINNINAPKIP